MMSYEDVSSILLNKTMLVDALGELPEYVLVNVYNTLCEYTHEEMLFDMDILDEFYYSMGATEIIDSLWNTFNTNCRWFMVNGYGYTESIDQPLLVIDLGDMANDMDMYRRELLSRELPSSISTILEELDKIDRS